MSGFDGIAALKTSVNAVVTSQTGTNSIRNSTLGPLLSDLADTVDPNQILLKRGGTGAIVFYPCGTTDDSRGSALLAAKTAATSGDTIVVPPGNYRAVRVVKAGVYMHFLAGAKVYGDASAIGPIIEATGAGTYYVLGFGEFVNLATGAGTDSGNGAAVLQTGGNTLNLQALTCSSAAADSPAIKSTSSKLMGNVQTISGELSAGVELSEPLIGTTIVSDRITSEGETSGIAGVKITATAVGAGAILVASYISGNAGPGLLVIGSKPITVDAVEIISKQYTVANISGSDTLFRCQRMLGSAALPVLVTSAALAYVSRLVQTGGDAAVALSSGTFVCDKLVNRATSDLAHGVAVSGAIADEETPTIVVASTHLASNVAYSVTGSDMETSVTVRMAPCRWSNRPVHPYSINEDTSAVPD